MNWKHIALACLLATFATVQQVSAQAKIGYCNLEALMLYLPETEAMNQEVQTFSKQLAEKLQEREVYAQGKLKEYQEKAQAGATEESLAPLKEELLKLDEEIRQDAADAEQRLLQKRQELIMPISDKIDKAISAYATANGYDFILNTVDGSGVSLILNGPEADNLTEKLLTAMGVELPKQEEAAQE